MLRFLFLPDSQVTNIRCEADFACALVDIGYNPYNYMWNSSYDESLESESLHIICNGDSSCLYALIFAHNVTEFILDCITAKSCLDLGVSIRNVTFSQINCYALSFSVTKII